MQSPETHPSDANSRESISRVRSPLHYGKLAIFGILFLAVGFAPLLAGIDLPLSAMQRASLRQRVQRFADRYDPTLDAIQRDAIANDASRSGAARAVLAARCSALAFLFAATGFFAWGFKSRQRVRSGHLDPILLSAWKTIYKRQFLCGLMFIVAAGCYWKYAAVQKRFDGAGAFVENGNIKLVKTDRTQEQLTAIWDHELVHVFGQGRFKKIGRDAWLAYAYQAILALERGGTAALPKSNLNADFNQQTMLHFFYQGVLGNAAFHENPGMAEAFVLDDVEKRIGPIRPDANTDNPDMNPAFAANWSSAIGLAGVAWMTAKGDADTALLYLDDRGSGMTAEETVHDLERRTPQHVNHDNVGMTPLIVEARQALFKDSSPAPKK